MLQRIRDSLESQKWLTYVVLGLLAIIFAAWGSYSLVNFSVGTASYAADADGQKISVEEAHNAWMRQQSQWQQRFGGDIPAQQKEILQDQLLESMVRDTLLTNRAHDLGYRVSEADVHDAIRGQSAFQVSGTYSADQAKAALAQAGLSIDSFTDELRGYLLRGQLENSIAVSDFLTPTELARMRTLQDEQREVRFARLAADKFAGDAPIDDAAVQAYYKAHEKQYMTSESAHIQYAELRLDTVAAQQTISDADLRAAYEKNKNTYVDPEKRHAQHILIEIGKDDAAARKLAEQVLAEAKAGKDFGQLAKQYSKDPGSADKGGDLDFADAKSFPTPFADALFAMKEGDIAGPVKTDAGYHIIKLVAIQPGKIKTLEEARPELEAELKRNRATDRFGEVQEQLQTKLTQPDANLDALTKEYGLQTGDVPHFLRGAGGGELGAAQPVQDLVFGDSALGIGHIGGPVLVGEDRLVVVKVLDHLKPEPKPVAEVRDGIVVTLRKQRGTAAAFKAAEAARGKLDSGTSFDDVAKELGVAAEPAKFVGRNDAAVPAQIRTLVFGSPKPAGKPIYRALQLDDGGTAIVALTKLREQADDQSKQADVAAAREALSRHGTSEVSAYIEEVRRTADVKKNLKALE